MPKSPIKFYLPWAAGPVVCGITAGLGDLEPAMGVVLPVACAGGGGALPTVNNAMLSSVAASSLPSYSRVT